MTQAPFISGNARPHPRGERADDGRPSSRREADGGAARRFDDMMRDRDGAGRDGDRTAASPFDLFRPMPTPLASANAPEAAAPPPSADLREIVEVVAERMLVADTETGQEVRIQLKDSVLPGVEIRIRQQEGRIVVEFVCANADSARFLTGQQDGLAALLGERLQTAAEVTITTADGTSSRTSDGGSGDGRSRQHYTAPVVPGGPDDDDSDETSP